MKKNPTLFIIFLTQILTAQIGIGTTNPNASLDIISSNQAAPSSTDGILIPRVDAFPSINPAAAQNGMLVYLTTTSGSNFPGFYYWSQPLVTWIGLQSSVNGGWGVTGNSGTVSGTNFIGTTDNQALDFRVNGGRKLRLETNGTLATLNMGRSIYIGLEAGNADNFSGFKYNVAIGELALRNNTTGSQLIAIGGDALRANITGNRNIAIGKDALTNNDSGDDNIAIGKDALNDNVTGHRNLVLGNNSLQSLTTGNGNIAIGTQSNPTGTNLTNAISIGGFNIAASHQIKMGNTLHTSIGGQVAWTAFSDGRFKSKIKENVSGLDFILKLRPVTYQIDTQKINSFFGIDQLSGYHSFLKNRSAKNRKRLTGFIAQEVAETAKSIGFDFDGIDLPKDDTESNYGIRYSLFVIPLVKAVQEQHNMIIDLQNQIKDLKNK